VGIEEKVTLPALLSFSLIPILLRLFSWEKVKECQAHTSIENIHIPFSSST